MKVRLIKTDKDKYHIETEDFDGLHLACYPHDITKQRLSLKNCQTIEQGYDLNKLVEEEYEKFDLDTRIIHRRQLQESLTNMFNKALKFLGDKQFTKDDMLNAYYLGSEDGIEYEGLVQCGEFNDMHDADKYTKTLEDNFEKWLNRKEWNVEILCNDDSTIQLDNDGCLILKRI